MLYCEVDLISICILLGILLQVNKSQDLKARLIFVLCLILFLIGCFEILEVVARQHKMVRLLDLSHAFVLPLFCALAYAWYLYVRQIQQLRRRGTVFDLLCQSLLALYFVFSLSSPWHRFLFDNEADTLELIGHLLWTAVAIPCVFGTLSIYLCVKDLLSAKRKLPLTTNLGLILMTMVGIFSGYLQYRLKILLVCPAITCCMLVYFITLQNTWIFRDPLTKLNNRSSLNHFLKHSFSDLARNYMPYILYLDVNRFKRINDNYGHVAGDLALKLIAEVLMLKVEHTKHYVCRLGGDEFVAVLMVHDEQEVVDFISTLREMLNLRVKQESLPFPISISVGTALLGTDSADFNDALELAENEMYSEKQYGASLL